MSGKSSSNKKGNKKHGRNEVSCKAYRASGRREKNKVLKLQRHLKVYPSDSAALNKLKELENNT
jgi:hypothetical protein